eukprot:4197057-Alexandrium_andersonii.AAC.1
MRTEPCQKPECSSPLPGSGKQLRTPRVCRASHGTLRARRKTSNSNFADSGPGQDCSGLRRNSRHGFAHLS